MNTRHNLQFRLPHMDREHLARAIACLQYTRNIAPAFCDWARDCVVDELADRLEFKDSGAIHEPRMMCELPTLTNTELSQAMLWTQTAVYNMQNFQLGKLADTLHQVITVAVCARLRRLETPTNAYAHA